MRVISTFLFYQLKVVKHRQHGPAELRVFLLTLGSMSEIAAANMEKI